MGAANRQTVLLLDDDLDFLELASQLLSMHEIQTVAFSQSQDALNYLKDHQIHAIISDINLSNGESGVDFYRNALKLIDDQTRFAFTTGRAIDDSQVTSIQTSDRVRVFFKPFSFGILQSFILDSWGERN